MKVIKGTELSETRHPPCSGLLMLNDSGQPFLRGIEMYPIVITDLKITIKFRKYSHFSYKSFLNNYLFPWMFKSTYLMSCSLASHNLRAWKGTGAGFCSASSPTVPSPLLRMSQNIFPRMREIWNLEHFSSTEHEKNMLNGSLSEWRKKFTELLSVYYGCTTRDLNTGGRIRQETAITAIPRHSQGFAWSLSRNLPTPIVFRSSCVKLLWNISQNTETYRVCIVSSKQIRRPMEVLSILAAF